MILLALATILLAAGVTLVIELAHERRVEREQAMAALEASHQRHRERRAFKRRAMRLRKWHAREPSSAARRFPAPGEVFGGLQ